jgi:aminopeptidase N
MMKRLQRLFFLLMVCPVCWQASSAQTVDVYSRPIRQEPSRYFDALHYGVALTFDLDQKRFFGTNTITLSPLKDDFNTCILHAEELIVDQVKDESGRPLRFEQKEGKVRISLSRTYGYGETVRFTVDYNAHDPKAGLFFDDATPDHPQMVSTVSWPDNARHWFPCYDHPHDKATQEMIITVPRPLKVLSNGRLTAVTEDQTGGTTTYHWNQDLPHSTYLAMLAVGPFEVVEDALEELPINAWVYPKDVEDARWIFRNTPAMIEFFNELFDYPYPWAKYDQVTSPRQGGGAEATSATVLGEAVIHDRRAEQDFSWERIIAHEVAHQWWGDLITLRSWEHTWLNESFATYSDYLYLNHAMGEEDGAYNLLDKKNQYLQEARERYMRPIVFSRYERPEDNFDKHTYPKGAAVLHMLRSILGDKPFFKTWSHFLHKHAFGAVDTHDFMVAVKEATGRNMDWFFEQFVFKPGHPVLRVSYTWDETAKEVHLKVVQAQDRSRGVPIYRVPFRIGIVTGGGRRSEQVWIQEREETFIFPSDERPLLVRFDEGNVLLKEWTFEKGSQELIYQLRNDDVIGRMWAADQLSMLEMERPAIEALKDKALEDDFWGVRKAACEALGRCEPDVHIGLFKKLSTDENSKVRASALRILGDFRNADLLPFFRKRFEEDDSYMAQAEALKAMGKCGDASQLPFLESAAAMKSPRDIICRAAEWARRCIEDGE